MFRTLFAILFVLSLCLFNTGCQTGRPNTTAGAMLGGATGGILGSAIGSPNGNSEEGAIIGALAGGLTGATIGNQADQAEFRQRQAANERAAIARQAAVTLDQVVQMSESGLNEELIINQIKTQGMATPVSTNDLIQLKNYGVSDSVIRQMQSTGTNVNANSAPPEFYGANPVIHLEPYCPPNFRPPVILHHPHHFPIHQRGPRRASGPRAGFSVRR